MNVTPGVAGAAGAGGRADGRAGATVGQPPARIIDANTAAIFGGVTEPTVPVQPLPQPGYYRHGAVHDTAHTWVGRLGTGLLVGGGFEDFTNDNLRGMTGGAGTWNARAIAGTRQFVGVEAAYVGAARGVDALGVQSNAVLVSNGVEGALRLNVPVVMRSRQLLEPFGFVGVGWSHYQVTNTNTNTSDLAADDDIMSLPMGGGLEYAIGRFMADARFTYRATYYNDLMRTGGNLNNWGVSTQVGVVVLPPRTRPRVRGRGRVKMTAWRCCWRCSVPSGGCAWRSTSRRRSAARPMPTCSSSTARCRGCTAGSRSRAAAWRSRTSAATTARTSTARS